MSTNYALFVFTWKSAEYSTTSGADYFNIYSLGKTKEQILIDANEYLRNWSKKQNAVITEWRMSDDSTQTFTSITSNSKFMKW